MQSDKVNFNALPVGDEPSHQKPIPPPRILHCRPRRVRHGRGRQALCAPDLVDQIHKYSFYIVIHLFSLRFGYAFLRLVIPAFSFLHQPVDL